MSVQATVRSLLTRTGSDASASVSRSEAAVTSLDVGSMLLAGVVLIALGLGIVALWRSHLKDALRESERGRGPTDSSTASNVGSSTASAETSAGPVAGHEVESTAGEELGSAPGETGVPSDASVVVDILETNGGRMRQAEIVENTDWSKSKVSMVLSEMEEEGTISKLRVGRENIVSLRGNEPEAAGSPFDDE